MSDQHLTIARGAAEQLLDALDTIGHQTADWSNEPLADVLLTEAWAECLHQLTSTDLWGRDNQMASGEFWKVAGQVLSAGRLQLHAREKPRGYAGDFEMLQMLCERAVSVGGMAGAFDRYFQQLAAVEAVRARTELVAQRLIALSFSSDRKPLRIVSVGSGPAMDLQAALALLPSERAAHWQVTLLDLDSAALDVAQGRLLQRLQPRQIVAVRENLFRLDRGKQQVFANADAVICTGLMDYLEDEPATHLLATIFNHLGPQGWLLVGNFAPRLTTRAFMEWIGAWYLIYRSEQQLLDLAAAAGIAPSAVRITPERLGVDLFIDARRG